MYVSTISILNFTVEVDRDENFPRPLQILVEEPGTHVCREN